jgi:carbon monoxide dehydrogenase subunit G
MTIEFIQEILESVPNQKIVSRMTAGRKFGNLSATGIWKFEPVADGTRVTFGWEVMLGGLLKMATPIFAPLARRTLRHDLVNLKKELEGTA